MTSFGQILDRLIDRTLARIDSHAGERRAEEPEKATRRPEGRPKNPDNPPLTK